jgi:hypothetical protein
MSDLEKSIQETQQKLAGLKSKQAEQLAANVSINDKNRQSARERVKPKIAKLQMQLVRQRRDRHDALKLAERARKVEADLEVALEWAKTISCEDFRTHGIEHCTTCDGISWSTKLDLPRVRVIDPELYELVTRNGTDWM